MPNWILCKIGRGKLVENGIPAVRPTHFPANSVGQIKEAGESHTIVWLIGTNETWLVSNVNISSFAVAETGDKFSHKICNICHCLKPVDDFQPNQNNKHGPVRRPSCKDCRTNIDKRPPKSQQAKRVAKKRPQTGDSFRCPICQKRTIVGITAKIVADHDHHTGNIRGFICDSCNTGLGRFKNGHDCLKNALAYLEHPPS